MLTTREVVDRSGVTISQVRHWVGSGIFDGAPGFEDAVLTQHQHGASWQWPESTVPIVATLARVGRALGSAQHDLLRLVLENYEDGFVILEEGVSLEWDLDWEGD